VESLNARRRDKALTWKGVLALAQTPDADRARAIDTQDADKQRSLSERQITDALTAVSIRLGTKTFSGDTYRDELKKMRKEGIKVDELRMPSEQQIARAMKRKLRQQANAFPLRARRREDPKKKSSTTVKAATKPVKRKQRPISPENQWKAALELAGLQQVEHAYLSAMSTSPRREMQRTVWADMDACLTDVCPYLEQLPASERSTYAGFQRWMRAQGRTPPSKGTLPKHGGWPRIHRLALERIHPGLKRESETNEQNQANASKKHAKTMQAPRSTPAAAEAREITPEPRPLEPIERLRALNFRSPTPKKHRAPRRNQAPSQTRIESVQSGRVQASKPPGKAPKSGSTT